MKTNPLLTVNALCLRFGGALVLNDLNFELRDHEILALIGPNGAGKTSALNCITGFYKPQKGSVYFQEQNISKLQPDERARLGISRTFQHIELFTGLSTLDNLMAARHIYIEYSPFLGMIFPKRVRNEEIEHRRVVEDIIDLLDLQPIRYSIVGMLPYGLRKRVDLGRALVMEPKILLLDEPMAGMNVEEKEDMARFILDVYDLKKTSIILVEHDMELVMDVAQNIVVLDEGSKIAEGNPKTIISDEKVAHAYLKLEKASNEE
jgi:branched-chain amino acid transport system ATP-binding protein